ncbi:hypothetical protein PCASD_04424 [Puccinia coronata f. sp. avenae]|uniref:Uncharacterized protein n=1 Tax=Puccinia coronata f. sp. avenae TaxID=200324 RepID=A0A2N5VC18_9BASI|nr:hypothetical protein PCASD_04424 [Puccinia coronata f. sp. avenae]
MNALSDHQIVSYLDDPNASDNWQDIMPLRDPVLPSVPYSPYCYDAASSGLTNPGIAGTHILTPQWVEDDEISDDHARSHQRPRLTTSIDNSNQLNQYASSNSSLPGLNMPNHRDIISVSPLHEAFAPSQMNTIFRSHLHEAVMPTQKDIILPSPLPPTWWELRVMLNEENQQTRTSHLKAG